MLPTCITCVADSVLIAGRQASSLWEVVDLNPPSWPSVPNIVKEPAAHDVIDVFESTTYWAKSAQIHLKTRYYHFNKYIYINITTVFSSYSPLDIKLVTSGTNPLTRVSVVGPCARGGSLSLTTLLLFIWPTMLRLVSPYSLTVPAHSPWTLNGTNTKKTFQISIQKCNYHPNRVAPVQLTILWLHRWSEFA